MQTSETQPAAHSLQCFTAPESGKVTPRVEFIYCRQNRGFCPFSSWLWYTQPTQLGVHSATMEMPDLSDLADAQSF